MLGLRACDLLVHIHRTKDVPRTENIPVEKGDCEKGYYPGREITQRTGPFRENLFLERVRSDVSVIPTLAATWGSLSCAATRPRCLLSLHRSLPYALEVIYHNGAMLIHTGEHIVRKVDQPVSLG